MKNIVTFLVLVVMAVPVYAAFDLNTTETFSGGLAGWTTNGAVSLETESSDNKYVKLAGTGTNTDNWIAHQFSTVSSGYYALSFDYRFQGDDNVSNDLASMGVSFIDGNLNIFSSTIELNTFSSTADLDNSADWKPINAPSPLVQLDGGKDYWVFFRLNEALPPAGESSAESNANGSVPVLNALHLDNIDLNLVSNSNNGGPQVVPAPGALILGTIGISLVGFLRRRKAL